MEEAAMKPAKACHMNLKKEEAFLTNLMLASCQCSDSRHAIDQSYSIA
jgi:hypothetical protein